MLTNRYSKKKPRKIESVPAITTLIVLAVVVFIAIDVGATGGTTAANDWYLLRIEMSSDTHSTLNGTLTFEIADGIYEQVDLVDGLPSFTTRQFRGSYTLSFDGVGVTFSDITISVYEVGLVYNQEVKGIQLRIDAVEG